MDAISFLKKDHALVKRLFREFDQAHGAHERSGAKEFPARLEALVTRIIRELSVHASIEEEAVYPLARKRIPKLSERVIQSLEEHHLVKVALMELARAPRDERFGAKVRVIAENVRHHIEAEERTLFPKMKDALERKELVQLGQLLARLKAAVPTRPHPRAPDQPPANLLTNVAAALFDRTRDAVRDLMT